MLYVGDDWAEAHHDVEIVNEAGRVLARRRVPEGVAGLSLLHELIADQLGEDDEARSVLVGIETDRGPWVTALAAAGYTVFPINPLQVARYRERHSVSGAKSDRGDAHTLAEIVRLDRAHHQPLAPDSLLDTLETWDVYTREPTPGIAHPIAILASTRRVNSISRRCQSLQNGVGGRPARRCTTCDLALHAGVGYRLGCTRPHDSRNHRFRPFSGLTDDFWPDKGGPAGTYT